MRLEGNNRGRSRIVFLAIVASMLRFAGPPSASAASCESIAELSLTNTKVTEARIVPAGAFVPPASNPVSSSLGDRFSRLASFCRVVATLSPSTDSEIKIEVWMPVTRWNGNLQSVGNGGWAGVISYGALADALAGGYATASTDTGHTGNNGKFAYGHPEKMIDFAYRSEHEMTVAAKAMIVAYYGRKPEHSYWNGCSTGGRQGLTEAQRYPDDYKGIIAGAPGNNRTHLYAWSLSIAQTIHKDPATYIPPSKYPMLHKAVLDKCDGLDGLKDGLISDPARCQFDPAALLCKGDDSPNCLTAQQVQLARQIYSSAKNPRTGQEIYPGLEPGSELGWAVHAGPEPLSYATDGFKYVTYSNPDWDFRSLNLDSDVAAADKADAGLTGAMNPDLKDFFGSGGKLLMYQGWSDQNVAPLNTVHYFQSVRETMGAAVADALRLFMVPGMGHCGGGEGPNSFDAIGALASWVETGQAPERIPASHRTGGSADRTRPICAYPKIAAYKGTGSVDEESNFVCKAP